ICTERRSLSRSNGTRRPLRLITVSSRNCTRSKVVKRKLQARQTRRRRMTVLSSVGRESLTCVSRLAQFGQRMCVSTRWFRHGRGCPGHPRLHCREKEKTWMPGPRPGMTDVMSCPGSCGVNRKPPDQRLDPFAHRAFGERVLFGALLRERVEHFRDQFANLAKLSDAEAARGAGGPATPAAR